VSRNKFLQSRLLKYLPAKILADIFISDDAILVFAGFIVGRVGVGQPSLAVNQ
jgi:hypothetical protein